MDVTQRMSAASRVPMASWAALGLLLSAYTFSWVDRYLFAILIEPIRLDLGLADWQIGLLSGFAFTLAYSFAGFPFARWADRGSRRKIIALAMGAWSAITVACGFVGSYGGLALARGGVAVCEAGCSPAAHSLISDCFPPRRRAAAFAIYGLGISLGIWLGLSLGGLVSERYGWRAAFILLGLPGIALALVVRFALREPQRGRFDHVDRGAPDGYSLSGALALLWHRRAFVAVTFGLAFLSFNGSGVQLWAPTYLLRAGHDDIATIGMLTGAVNGVAGIVGTLFAGLLADRFATRDVRWYCWIAIASVAITIPAQWLFVFGHGSTIYIAYAVAMFSVATYTAPLFSVGQMLLPPRLRAFGAATMLFVLNLIGPGAGPAAIGAMSDRFAGGLGPAMAAAMVSLLPAVLCLAYAAGRLARDVAGTVDTAAVVMEDPALA